MFSSADGSIGYLYKKYVTNREIPIPSVGPTVVTHSVETQLVVVGRTAVSYLLTPGFG